MVAIAVFDHFLIGTAIMDFHGVRLDSSAGQCIETWELTNVGLDSEYVTSYNPGSIPFG
jgi:hypothetical protein